MLLHNKTPIYSAWGLLRVCAACPTPRLNQSYELRPPWEQYLRYVPHWAATDTTTVMPYRRKTTFSIRHLSVHCVVENMGWLTMGASNQLHLQMRCKHWWNCLLQLTELTVVGKFSNLVLQVWILSYLQGIYTSGNSTDCNLTPLRCHHESMTISFLIYRLWRKKRFVFKN